MKQKKKGIANKNREEIFGFNTELETRIYIYLCKDKINESKEEKKLIKELKKKYKKDLKKVANINRDINIYRKSKFAKYSEWESYVKKKYDNYSKESLSELKRYLNYKQVMTITFKDILFSFILPVFVAVIASSLSNFTTQRLDVFSELSGKLLLVKIIGGTFIILFYLLYNIIFYLLPILGMIKYIMKTIVDGHTEKKLYEDYINILDDIINFKN